MKDKILLFIPAYNCQKQIIRVLGQLDQEAMAYLSQVIVVNNRSTDETETMVSNFVVNHKDIPVTLLRNNDNYGLGGSHKVAFAYAIEHQFDYVIVLHGDDQGTLSDLLPVLKKGIHKKYDCVLGARFMVGSRLTGYSKFRTFGNVIYDFLFSAVVRNRIFDLGSGLNLYRTDMLKDGFYQKFPDNLMFNYCMILASRFYHHKLRFYPISWREDDQVSNVKMLNQAITVLKMLAQFAINPASIKQDYRTKKIEKYEAEVIA
ncbi:MAG: glycosyltransferase family 2 protein [Clostridia bacterium]|mgnify:CR=1 FL=1|nr:glycosyltransferase family 2 protein [Clostridia bacterium]